MPGRRKYLTEELIQRVCEIIAGGNHDSTALAAIGIPSQTYYGWRKKGREDDQAGEDTIHAQLYRETERARAEAEAIMVQVVRSASVKQWQAAAWWLERKYPGKWALPKFQSSSVKEAQDDIVKLLREGAVTPEEVRETVGDELAHELFERAGIIVARQGETQASSG